MLPIVKRQNQFFWVNQGIQTSLVRILEPFTAGLVSLWTQPWFFSDNPPRFDIMEYWNSLCKYKTVSFVLCVTQCMESILKIAWYLSEVIFSESFLELSYLDIFLIYFHIWFKLTRKINVQLVLMCLLIFWSY